MNYAHYTDEELHRIARDSTDPLTLELMRRMDANGDELRWRELEVTELKDSGEEMAGSINELHDKIEKAREALEE